MDFSDKQASKNKNKRKHTKTEPGGGGGGVWTPCERACLDHCMQVQIYFCDCK